MNNILDPERINPCTSCGACYAVCPTDAISFVKNQEGFYRPNINENLCVSCGNCKKICYVFDNSIKRDERVEDYLAIGLKSSNKDILNRSSSGGACFEIVKYVLSEGYSVLGVKYDYDTQEAKGIVFNEISEFHKIQGSKYFQANISDALEQCLRDKERKYAVFGTPCQIYAIRKIILEKKAADRFILIDIFCHGAPTVELWKKYYAYISKKYMQMGNIVDIDFRSKRRKWHKYCTTFHFSSRKQITSKIINDPFYTLFFSKEFFNDACYECKLRSTLAYSDIRIGDFWGARYDTDLEGVSCVIATTEKGKFICSQLTNILHQVSFSEVVKAQSYGAVHIIHKDRRKKLLQLLSDDTQSITNILVFYKKDLTFREKISKLKKDATKLVPIRISNFVKKIYHTIKYR